MDADGTEYETTTEKQEDLKPAVLDLQQTDTGTQQFIILSRNATVPLSVGNSSDENNSDSVSGPPSKLIRLEGEDGQTYVLAVAGDAGDLTQIHKPVCVTEDTAEPLEGLKLVPRVSGAGAKKSSNNAEDVTQAWFTTRDDKAALQSKGHTWRQGQWTKDEIDLLEANINSYCKERHIVDPTEIIFEMTKDERKDFYRTIARGLQRPLFSVYRRVTRMYDQKNHMGKYTPIEMAKLRELRTKHGNDWAAIGAVLGRSASSVKDKCRLMKDTCNAGKWLPEEERRLAAAVYELAGVKPGESVTHGLSWALVAEKVLTRSEKQCRTKWLNYLNWKQQGGSEWTRQDDINLILRIASMGVGEDTDIDWNELSQDWASVRSPQWLRGKWWSLKRHVPDYQILTFPEIIDHLKTLHMNVRLKNPAVRLTRVGLSRAQNVADLPLQIPVTLQSAGITLEGSGEDVERTFEAYEVLQQWTPTSSGALLITQPQTNPAISLTSATLSTDHIIVHTLPVSQAATTVKSNENVTVQMNHQPQVIISTSSADEASLDGSVIAASIQLPDGLGHTQQDLQSLTHGGEIRAESCEILGGQEQSEIIPSESSFDSQTVSDSGIHSEVDQSDMVNEGGETPDIVIVGSASSLPQFSQSNSNDGELMSGFSDPILNSDSSDLICSASDGENEKTQSAVLSEDMH